MSLQIFSQKAFPHLIFRFFSEKDLLRPSKFFCELPANHVKGRQCYAELMYFKRIPISISMIFIHFILCVVSISRLTLVIRIYLIYSICGIYLCLLACWQAYAKTFCEIAEEDGECKLCLATSRLIWVVFRVLETYNNNLGWWKGTHGHDMLT